MRRILIVGAGPTGLMLAIELARRGVDFRIIDRNAERTRLSKAMVVHVRTLEIYDALEIAQEAIAAGTLLNAGEFHPDGGGPFTIRFAGIEGPYSRPLILEQSENERILEEKLLSLGVRVERENELVGMEEIGDGSIARIGSSAGEETARFNLIVGCDGASSAVRRMAGFSFEGGTYDDQFILGDVAVDWPYPDDRLRAFLSDEGLLLAFPMRGARRYRLIGVRKGDRYEGDPSLEEFRAAASRLVPVEMRISDPAWFSRYRVHCRGAPTYRRGNVILAGDAAHVHSPAGGQGMNTGLQDAWNLGWKLAAWASGGSDGSILDTYDAERRPFGEFLLSTTDAIFRTMLDAGPMLRFVRKRVAAPLVRLEAVQRRVAAFVSQVGIRYAGGPLVASDEPFRAATLTPGRPQVGERAPQAYYEDSGGRAGSVFSDLRDTRYHLYLLGRPERPALESAQLKRSGEAVGVHAVQSGGPLVPAGGAALPEKYPIPAGGHLLVRPDGYIAAMGGPNEFGSALAILDV